MKKVRLVLIGLGNVNIGLLKILAAKKIEIAKEGIELLIVGVADSSGIAVKNDGYFYEELVNLKAKGSRVNELDGYLTAVSTEDIVKYAEADILIEGSPVDMKTGSPGLQTIRKALAKGLLVVSANKAPLVLAFDELHLLAKKHGSKLLYSAAVCGGLPLINVLQRDLKATKLISLRGIFNATSNFILEELENGGSFEEAVREAQRIGAAEADPSLDIEGYDTANKLYIIMKSFTNFSGCLSDIRVEGVRHICVDSIKQAGSRNQRIKLIASAEKEGNKWILSIKPTEVSTHSFLGSCDGWEMGIELRTDHYEYMAMKIREKDPVSTSAAVLRDIINISAV